MYLFVLFCLLSGPISICLFACLSICLFICLLSLGPFSALHLRAVSLWGLSCNKETAETLRLSSQLSNALDLALSNPKQQQQQQQQQQRDNGRDSTRAAVVSAKGLGLYLGFRV